MGCEPWGVDGGIGFGEGLAPGTVKFGSSLFEFGSSYLLRIEGVEFGPCHT